MKKIFIIIISFFSFFNTQAQRNKISPQFNYHIELKDNSEDVIKVKLKIEKGNLSGGIFQFVSSIPGTYQILDIGRYIKNLKVYNKKGKIINTEKISANQWKISEPDKAKEIYYEVADTWDTVIEKDYFYPFFGMSLEKDHAFVNTYCIIGYFSDFEQANYQLSFDYPQEWSVGSPTQISKNGYYEFNSFSKLADTPFLFGRLSKATFDFEGTSVSIYTYSQHDKINSEALKPLLEKVVRAEQKFMKKIPVDHYAFLFHFDNSNINGALEYNNASMYTLTETDLDEDFSKLIATDAAHEFFHVISPLNVRSEYINNFNYASPKASEHIWFYEGITEWASDMMLLKNGDYNLDFLFNELSGKLLLEEKFDKNYSLSQISLNCYTDKGRAEFENVYHRGTLVASLLDILILDLSDGKKGLRDILLEMNNLYSKDKPFDEKTFFSVFTKLTYPQVGEFLDKYVKNNNVLPVHEIYEKVGINYTKEHYTGNKILSVGFELFIPDGKIKVRYVTPKLKEMGLQDFDELIGFNDIETRLDNTKDWVSKIAVLKPDENYTIKVKRGEKIIVIECKVIIIDQVEKHLFEIIENPSLKQKALQENWMKNL